MAKEEASYQQQLLEHIIDKSNLEEYFFLVLKPNLASAALGLHIFTAFCCFLVLAILLKRGNVSNNPNRNRRGSRNPGPDPESGLGPGIESGTGTGTESGIGIGDVIGSGGHVIEAISRIANTIQLGGSRTEEDNNNNNNNGRSVEYDSVPTTDNSPRVQRASIPASAIVEYSEAQGAVRRANQGLIEAIRNARGRVRARGDSIRSTNPSPSYPGARGTRIPSGFDTIRSSTFTSGYEAPLPARSDGAGGVEPDGASTSLPVPTREGPSAAASLP